LRKSPDRDRPVRWILTYLLPYLEEYNSGEDNNMYKNPSLFVLSQFPLSEEQIKEVIKKYNVFDIRYLPPVLQDLWNNPPSTENDLNRTAHNLITWMEENMYPDDIIFCEGDARLVFMIQNWFSNSTEILIISIKNKETNRHISFERIFEFRFSSISKQNQNIQKTEKDFSTFKKIENFFAMEEELLETVDGDPEKILKNRFKITDKTKRYYFPWRNLNESIMDFFELIREN